MSYGIDQRLGVVVGYDFVQTFTLRRSRVPVDLSSATSIVAALVSRNACEVLVQSTCSSSAPGASWTTGVIAVSFTAAQTKTISVNDDRVELEIAVTMGGTRMCFRLPLTLSIGAIA